MTEQEFKLDPKKFHVGNFLIDKAIDGVVKAVNDADLTHDGKKDVGQIVGVFRKLAPVLKPLGAVINFDRLEELIVQKLTVAFLNHGVVKPDDRAKFESLAAEALKHLKDAGSLLPKSLG